MVKISEKAKKEIVKIIHESEGKGANEIFQILIERNKGMISKPTYLKILRRLIENKKVFEIKDAHGRKSKLVSLTRKKEIDRIARESSREFKKFKTRLEKYDELKLELSDKQKIRLYADFHMAFWIMKWKLNEIPEFLQKPSIRKLDKDFEDLEQEMFFSFLEPTEHMRISNLGTQNITNHYFAIVEQIDKQLN